MAFTRRLSLPKLGIIVTAFVAGGAATVALTGSAAPWQRTAADRSSCGEVLIAGGDWLGGQGVDVRTNGVYQGQGTSCANDDRERYDLDADPPVFGFGWQCVELANRLYAVKGWFPRLWLGPDTNGGAKWLFTYAHERKYQGLTAHPNGSGYRPVPGDLIVHGDGTYGHVAVVDRIDHGTLYAVEQNRSIDGRSEYTYDASAGTVAQPNADVTGFIHAERNDAPATAPDDPRPAAVTDPGPPPAFTIIGDCTTTKAVLRSQSSGFTAGRRYRITVTYPDGARRPRLATGVAKRDGSAGWRWRCAGKPPGVYTTTITDLATNRSTGAVSFRVGRMPAKAAVPGSRVLPADAPVRPPAPQLRTVTIYNKVTDGASAMREDTPAYFSTVTRNLCKSGGCAVPGTDLSTGFTTTATCQTHGERTTNGEDADPRDDANPNLYSSDLWYGVTAGGGRTGYLCEVWVTATDRNGLGLPAC